MPVTAVGIIGSCARSAEVALRCACKNMQVRVYDVSRAALQLSMARVEWSARGGGQTACLKNIEPVQKLEMLAGADLVLEAGTTSQERFILFRKLEEILGGAGCICIRCGQSDPAAVIGEISAPERFAGLNISGEAESGFAEVARFEKTADETLERAVEFLKTIGRDPLVGRYAPGLVADRLLYAYVNTGIALLEKGRGLVPDIDAAVREKMRVPAGPFELADRCGIDTLCGLGDYLFKAQGSPERLTPAKTADRLNQYGECGRRNGLGFYVYEEGRIVGVNPRLQDIVKYLGLSMAAPERMCADIFTAVAAEAKLTAADVMVSEYDIESAARRAFGWPKGPSGMAREAAAAEPVEQNNSGELL